MSDSQNVGQDLNKPQEASPALAQAKPKRFRLLHYLLALLVIVIIAAGFLGYLYWKKNNTPSINKPVAATNSNSAQTISFQIAKPLATDYHLIADGSKTTYFDDGLIQTGALAGYHRVIADSYSPTFDAPGSSSNRLIFATLDFKKFVVDQLDWTWLGTPANSFFSASVTGGAEIPTNSPDVINYNGLAYSQSALATDGSPLESLPQNSSPLMPSIYQGLQFYSSPSASGSFIPKNIDTSKYTQDALSILNAEQQYFAEDSSVYSVDQSGVIYKYNLKAPNITPSLQSANSDIYTKYNVLLPGGCGVGPLYVLQNINAGDLVPIVDQTSGISTYGFKDSNHPLTAAEYADKILIYATNSGLNFSDFNNEMAPSNLQQYAAKNPVLIFKDPWGRYVGVGEYEYNLPGGCGKPVIYLYPQQKETVTIKLSNATFFNADIPTYTDGWKVSAEPDGQLTDLQPEDTNCDKINYSLPGMSYAKSACKSGIYPYLYWSGSTVNAVQPDSNNGWVVSKSDLRSFLNDKLSEMGFSLKEISDMTSYWVPEMLSKNQPYFKINFYQTADMDKFIPLIVTPKPDSELRMFMNWSPLDSMPLVQPQPEQLVHIQRKGFTLVEWGGLKQ